MVQESGFKDPSVEGLRENLTWFATFGIALMVLGIVSLAAPFIAGMGVESIIAVLFLIGGVMHFMHAFQSHKWKRSVMEFLAAFLYVATGVSFLTFPFAGALTLTLFLACFFLVKGAFKIVESLRLREVSNWGWVLLSGIISLILGGIIFAGLPMTIFWAVGVLAGVDFLFGGWSMVMLAYSMRRALKEGLTFCIGSLCFQ